jgi:hypothetical protein
VANISKTNHLEISLQINLESEIMTSIGTGDAVCRGARPTFLDANLTEYSVCSSVIKLSAGILESSCFMSKNSSLGEQVRPSFIFDIRGGFPLMPGISVAAILMEPFFYWG